MSDNEVMRRVRPGTLTHESGIQFETIVDSPKGTHFLVPADEIERLRQQQAADGLLQSEIATLRERIMELEQQYESDWACDMEGRP